LFVVVRDPNSGTFILGVDPRLLPVIQDHVGFLHSVFVS
jgi:hypothetical protein